MTFGSLFAGIGGMDLGLERAGLTCKWQVEIDGYCRRVLAKHWPDVRRWDDVRAFPPAEGDWSVDLIAGGFPCQDISSVGRRAGIEGERSGLWSRYAEIVGLLRPSYVLMENVPNLLSLGLDRVLGDLSAIGYDAEWETLPAGAFGAPHLRWRVFVVAYPTQNPAASPVFRTARDLKGFSSANLEEVLGHWFPDLIGRRVSRDFVNWMMGFPTGHLASVPSETPSSPRSPSSSAG